MTDREWKTIRTIRDSRKSKKKKLAVKKRAIIITPHVN